MGTGRLSLASLGWLAAIAVIALGGAGLVTALDVSPAGGGRPELTYRGDRAVTPILDATEVDLRRLSDDVASLGVQARAALASLNGADLTAVDAAVVRGDVLVEAIRTRSREIAAALGGLPLLDTPEAAYKVSTAVRDRRTRLDDALAATADLDASWARLTTGSLAASRLSDRLAAHDQAVLDAAAQGRAAEYQAAVATLDGAVAALVDARVLRDRLAATVDVAVLDEWLDRNAAYDKALRGLYLALKDVRGRVTVEVRAAIAAEQQAKDRLPGDSRGMILIMAEIGRGGMNRAVIAIEEARGALADALATTVPNPSPSEGPTDLPADSTPPS